MSGKSPCQGLSRIEISPHGFALERILPYLVGMEEFIYLNTAESKEFPDTFKDKYHCHILCHKGRMDFQAMGRHFSAHAGDLVIWQMTTLISEVEYSEDFDADCLMISNGFLNLYNPEQIWATKGYIFIKNNPVFHLEEDEFGIFRNDFGQFRKRIGSPRIIFRDEIIGRLFQILLMDMWDVYSREMDKMNVDGSAARILMDFLMKVQVRVRQHREVSWYAEKLFVTPKYLSDICRDSTGKSALFWIEYYATHEILKLLNDPSLSITDICEEMNFAATPSLTRYLKRTLGVTPSEYRNRK